MRVLRVVCRAITAGAILLLLASPADAQWHFGVQVGSTHTQSATVSINEPSQGLAQEFHGVDFDGSSFRPPLYWGARLGRVIAHSGSLTLAIEGEYIHAKMYADTTQTYVITPIGTGAPFTTFAPMDATVQRFNMSHGLNFLLANLVMQAPLHRSGDGPVTLNLRVGVGPTIPHAESTVLGESKEQYEYGGMAFGGGVGVNVRLAGPVSGLLEYKVTYARPEITLAHGTGTANVLMHHVIAGVVVRVGN